MTRRPADIEEYKEGILHLKEARSATARIDYEKK